MNYPYFVKVTEEDLKNIPSLSVEKLLEYKKDVNKCMTRASCIRVMTDEELARFLWGFRKEKYANDDGFINIKTLLSWLKSSGGI
jgi:hypothetical protein